MEPYIIGNPFPEDFNSPAKGKKIIEPFEGTIVTVYISKPVLAKVRKTDGTYQVIELSALTFNKTEEAEL